MAAPHTVVLTSLVRPLFRPLDTTLAPLIAPDGPYGPVKATITRDGCASAITCVLAAAVVNHVRRSLTPWLGAFVWRHAFAGMRMARSSPHIFLDGVLRSNGGIWVAVGAWACQLTLVGVVRRLLLEKIAADGERRGDARWSSRASDVLLDLCRVLFLALCLALLEGAYTETCWAASTIYAMARLLRDGEQGFLRALVLSQWPVAALQACLVGGWLWNVCLPAAARTVAALRRGEVYAPVLTYWLWAGTVYLVRYSNKYFIMLEMSDMLVTFGWMVLGSLVVMIWGVEGLATKNETRQVTRRRSRATVTQNT